MWIYVLSGLAVGIMALMVVTFLKQNRFRMLVTDVHLNELVQAMASARTAPVTTLAGVTLEWRTLKVHSALLVSSKRAIQPEGLRFLMGVLLKAMGREATAALILPGKNSYALVVPGPVPSVVGDSSESAQWRSAGVDAMRGLAVVPGSLAAYQ